MLIIQQVTTKHDVNGNPRRGWQVWHLIEPLPTGRMALHPDYLGYVDEGYAGHRALSNAIREEYPPHIERPMIISMAPVAIMPGAHREIRNGRRFGEPCERLPGASDVLPQVHALPVQAHPWP